MSLRKSSESTRPNRFINGWTFGLLGVFALAISLYLPALRGLPIWDDEPLIFGNGSFGTASLTDAFTKPFGNYFRPLTAASFALEHMYAHGNTVYYHATNIILHGVTAVLVCFLVYVLSLSKPAGILGGLFFAAQPMQVGAAAWIGGRTDVLSAFFLTLFLVSLVQYLLVSNKGWMAASWLTFFLAILTKEQAVAILPAVPLSVFVFGSQKWKDSLRLTAPYAAILVVYIALWSRSAPVPLTVHSSVSYTIMLAMRTAAHYGFAFLVPNRASLITFTLENYTSFVWIPLGAVVVITTVLFIRRMWSSHRELAWITICGLLVYIPISNCPNVPSLVVGPFRCAEAGIGIASLFGMLTAIGIAQKRYFLSGLLGLNLLAGTVVTWWGVHEWLSPQSFFKSAVANDPHFIVGVEYEASYLDAQGQSDRSIKLTGDVLKWLFATEHWPELLDIRKRSAITPGVKQRLRSNSGIPNIPALGIFIGANALSNAKVGRTGDAILAAKDALIFTPDDPWLNFLYGRLVFKTDRRDAIRHWEAAMKSNPLYRECAIALGHEKLIDKQYAEAIPLLQTGLVQYSNNGFDWLDLADAEIAIHDWDRASEALGRAMRSRLTPSKAAIAIRRKTIDASTHLNPKLMRP